MKIHYHINQLPDFTNAVITTGTFDGVHLAHQTIIAKIKELANGIGGESVLITFNPHPQQVLHGKAKDIKIISTLAEKIELLKPLKIDHLVVVPFDLLFANQTADEYINAFLFEKFHPKIIVMGYNHRFGNCREGDVKLLAEVGKQKGFEVVEIQKQMEEEVTISSTRIRTALLDGNISEANQLLGRAYSFSGTVVHGKHLGTQIGFPTANVSVADEAKLIPANGVYVVEVLINETKHHGMMNIGVRPTVDGTSLHIEVHLLDFKSDIYNQTITVNCLHYLRPEQKFAGLDKLIEQLGKDKMQTEEYFLMNSISK